MRIVAGLNPVWLELVCPYHHRSVSGMMIAAPDSSVNLVFVFRGMAAPPTEIALMVRHVIGVNVFPMNQNV